MINGKIIIFGKALVSALASRTYQLKITTCYGGNARLLKKPKIYEYAQPVVIYPKV